MQSTNYLTLHSSRLTALQTSTLSLSTLTGSTIRASFLTLSSLTVSSINGALPGSGSSTWLTGTGGIIYYNGGHVGIGTSTSISNFQIYGATNPNITLGNSTYPSDFQIAMASAGGNYSGSAIAGDTVIRTISGNLMLQAMGGGSAAIYLSKTNNYVGINNTNPVANLDVSGSLRITSQTYAAITSGTGVDIIYSGAGQISCGTRGVGGALTAAAMNYAAAGHTFFTGASAGTNAMTIHSSGQVGIGTNVPIGTLQVGHATPTGAGISDGNIVFGKTNGTGYRYAKMGYDADFNLCIGDYGYAGGLSWINTFKMAYSAPVNSLTINSAGQIGIGIASASHALHVVGAIFATGDITAFSDQRYKQNIVCLDRSLDKIRSLSGYSYTRQDYRPGERQIGLLAQEVKAVLPEAVHYDSINDVYSVNYNCLMAPVIESIKELSDQMEAQAKIIRDQQSVIQAQQSVIQKLLARLGPESPS